LKFDEKGKIMCSKLFEDYIETEQEWLNAIISNDYSSKWDVPRAVKYQNGVVLGKYRENDPDTLKAVQAIELNCSKDEFIKLFFDYYSWKIKEYGNRTENLLYNKKALVDLKSIKLEEWLFVYHRWIVEECKKREPVDLISYSLSLLLHSFSFDMYKENRISVYSHEQQNIEMIYSNSLEQEEQFLKYQLITINEGRDFLPIRPPRIYDQNINKTITLHNVPNELTILLNKLYSNKLIGKLSFRLSNLGIYDGKFDRELLLEEIQFGKAFSLIELGSIKLTKLYSESLEDTLWVNIDNANITFEELCDDFNTINDQVVTQVIHLEYKREASNDYYITHIDHEYIFYTIDEYAERLINSNQKGTSRARMKTFKADDCHIPMTETHEVTWKDINGEDFPPVNMFALHFILECYFKHLDLLKEYFSKCEN